MRSARILVLALIVLVALGPGFAAALSNCAGMSADCEGPCGTTTGVVGSVRDPFALRPNAWDVPGPLLHLLQGALRLLDLPPRSLLAQ